MTELEILVRQAIAAHRPESRDAAMLNLVHHIHRLGIWLDSNACHGGHACMSTQKQHRERTEIAAAYTPHPT